MGAGAGFVGAEATGADCGADEAGADCGFGADCGLGADCSWGAACGLGLARAGFGSTALGFNSAFGESLAAGAFAAVGFETAFGTGFDSTFDAGFAAGFGVGTGDATGAPACAGVRATTDVTGTLGRGFSPMRAAFAARAIAAV